MPSAARAVRPQTARPTTTTPAPPATTVAQAARSAARAAMPAPPAAMRLREGKPQPRVAPADAEKLLQASGPGEPLPQTVREALEKRLGVSLGLVRVHRGSGPAEAVDAVAARAVTYGANIFLGPRERPTDLALMAHEVAHVVQQQAAPKVQKLSEGAGSDAYESEAHRAAAAVVAGQSFQVRERTAGPRAQRWGVGEVLDRFANWANAIPGFRMFTVVLGVNPINMSTVERSAANIMRAVVEFIPGGNLVTRALDTYGIFDRVGAWVEGQIRTLGMAGSAIRQAVMDFVNSLGLSDIFDLGDVWERAKRIFTEPIGRIISFAGGLITGILGFVREAVLRPLAALAEGTAGYDLLKAVLGQDPVTGEAVERSADTLIGGFMKLIGQEEIWNNLKRANAVARAWAWFQGALSGLMGFVRQIPGMIVSLLQSIGIADFLPITNLFGKVVGTFGGFVGSFFSWAGGQVMSLLQIIFEVVAPGAMPYIRRAAGALSSIFRNPVGFVGNLVRAGIQGFRQFAGNFLNHLRRSLVEWLTGTLSGAGVYVPQGFNLREIIKFVLSVLGLTWQNIRQKIVRVIGETAVSVLETGFDLVVTLVREGPAAAWQKILEGISNLREMVMGQIMTFVRDRVVQAAITRLVTSLNPAGAFIQAVIAIYNTIMFFVERLRQIMRVVGAFIDSISAIASGNIGTAANRVETTMGGMLTLVISFLARIAGLGRVSDAVARIVNRVRAPIDRALDRVVAWIVAQVRRLGGMIRGRDARSPEEKQRDLDRAVRELRPRVRELFRRGPPGRLFRVRVAAWRLQYRLTTLTVTSAGRVEAAINPVALIDQLVPVSNQVALAVIQEEITRYFAPGPNTPTAASVRATGAGTRAQPLVPAAVGNIAEGIRSLLLIPGEATGETSWVLGTHGGQPVIVILQRTASGGVGQGEVYMFNPQTRRRVRIGAYQRSREVPGVSAAPAPTGATAATRVAAPFGGSGSFAAGYSEEMLVEGRVPTTHSAMEAHAAASLVMLGMVESIRNPLAAVTVPSAAQATARSGVAAGTTLGDTMGASQAARGSADDWRLARHALSRFSEITGGMTAPASVPDPRPGGVPDPAEPGSERRAAAQMNMSVQVLSNTILRGMVDENNVVMLASAADRDKIRERTREFLRQHYGNRRG